MKCNIHRKVSLSIHIFLTCIVFICGCTIGTTNKITTNQYPCDTDSSGNKLQNVNIYIDKLKTNQSK